LVFKFFGEVCLNYMTSVKAGYLLKALTGKSKGMITTTMLLMMVVLGFLQIILIIIYGEC
jgi:hypothetical protein